MWLVWCGVFVCGLSMSAAAAFLVPKRKGEWPVKDEPRVKVSIKTGRNDK